MPGAVAGGVAEERAGPGGGVDLKYVDETAALFRLRRGGVVQQSGGELHASDHTGPENWLYVGSASRYLRWWQFCRSMSPAAV